ncbi:MAG: Thermosome subunit alpha [Candidatus Methanophagaceae archaeon]|nr:MAG: Thermosome subunit alpha [Methanophagales archaeon]KAF5429387.1 Chaperonin GroEL (HSP60 family) [Methanophagales archaeon]
MEDRERTIGKNVQSRNIMAAKAIANAVKPTLGPKGRDKMLVNSMGDVVITNDGATIHNPPTSFPWLYGMNFRYMPELECCWSDFTALFLMRL